MEAYALALVGEWSQSRAASGDAFDAVVAIHAAERTRKEMGRLAPHEEMALRNRFGFSGVPSGRWPRSPSILASVRRGRSRSLRVPSVGSSAATERTRTSTGCVPAMSKRAAFLAKHAARITRDPVYGCWLWADPTRKSGGLDRDGYGLLWTSEGPRSAHSVAYEAIVGPVPRDKNGAALKLDHICRTRNCIRPEHLEPVTGSVNDLRRNPRYRARQTQCRNGHSLALAIMTPSGGRICRRSDCQGPEATP